MICRWAFCRSSRANHPSPVPIQLTVTWKCLGASLGKISDILLIALKQRCNDNLDTEREALATQFRLHLHRGIAYLTGSNLKKK